MVLNGLMQSPAPLVVSVDDLALVLHADCDSLYYYLDNEPLIEQFHLIHMSVVKTTPACQNILNKPKIIILFFVKEKISCVG